MLDQEEEIRNIENELSTKRKDIYDLNAKLSRIQNEYDAMVSKNKHTNMDLVEARLLFKQQCCVLV
jgi:peptidoglycan hydrolase CwlO-like protein